MVLAVLLAIPAVAAIADQLNVDGDILTNATTNVNLGDVNPGQTLSPQVSFQLNCNSQNHVNQGATVSLNYSAANSTIPSGGSLSATNASISVPNSWPADNTQNGCNGVANVDDNGNSQVTITAPKSPGAKSFVVTYDVVAPTDSGGNTGIQGGTTRSVTYNMNVRNVAPVINAFGGATTVTEGQNHPYSILASDANEDTLTYGLTKASGTANVNITSLGNGNFNVQFLTAGSVVLRASVSDGTNAAVTQDKTVTVAPAVTATSVSDIIASTSTFGGTTDLSAKVSPSGAPGSVDFYVNGSSTPASGTVNYNSSTGVATLSNYSHGLNASNTAYSVKAVFTPSNSSYSSSEATNASALTVNKAVTTTTVTCTGAPFTYTGNPITPCSANVTGAGGLNQAVTPVSYQDNVNAGTATASASYAGDANHEGSSDSKNFNITFNFTGFSSPVDNNNVLNSAKAGQAIPLKWRLTNASGNPVTNLLSTDVKVSVVNYNCGLSVTTDLLEEYAAGSSGLQNLGNGYYQFNWKTPTNYANSCKTMTLDLGEGTLTTPHTALFKFTK
jgi:hypothetical protein